MSEPVIIWGASGHALVVADILSLVGKFETVGFLDDYDVQVKGKSAGGAPVLGSWEAVSPQLDPKRTRLIFGFGDCSARIRLSVIAESAGFQFVSAIHPRSMVAESAAIGLGSVIVAGAVVNPEARIGRHCIINSCASVDHECVLGDSVHIGPGARLGGRARIGNGTWVGMGAMVLDRITVGSGSIIGAGAVVTQDVPDNVVAFGVPARVRRSMNESAEILGRAMAALV